MTWVEEVRKGDSLSISMARSRIESESMYPFARYSAATILKKWISHRKPYESLRGKLSRTSCAWFVALSTWILLGTCSIFSRVDVIGRYIQSSFIQMTSIKLNGFQILKLFSRYKINTHHQGCFSSIAIFESDHCCMIFLRILDWSNPMGNVVRNIEFTQCRFSHFPQRLLYKN